ncbi:DedA family protein [Alphaproteobacteria bacterium HT1-32]|nr:DedA family protein [Alphaproteobacteria bacterium HT1-32]
MAQINSLILEYGTLVYILLFAYCALKSGALPLFAGLVAQYGSLDVMIVAAVTLAGGYLGDELRFFVARRYGIGFMLRRERLQRMMARAQLLMQRYGAAYIFLYRYPKGMRTIGALPVGLGDMQWRHFTLLNLTSAALWCLLLVGGGYLFGRSIEQAVASGWGAASILLLIGFLALSWLGWRQVRQPEKPGSTL